MDGVIIDSEIVSYEIIRDILETMGHDLTIEEYAKTIGKNVAAVSAHYEQLVPDNHVRRNIIAEYAEQYEDLVREGHQRIKPGVIELLNELDRLGLKRALASSNTGYMVNLNLDTLGISGRFDALVFDGMVAHAKPFPDLFLKAAELTETSPERCLVIEDSLAGVRAAHAANIPVIVVPDIIELPSDALALCERRCDNLLGVIDYLREQAEACENQA